jgi:hypothetical protein
MNYYVLPFTSYDERNRMIEMTNPKHQPSITPIHLSTNFLTKVLSKALNQSLKQYSAAYYYK